MTQAERDRLVALKKAKKKLITQKEAAEELGIKIGVGELLVVDWSAPIDPRPRPLLTFIFEGGSLSDPGAIHQSWYRHVSEQLQL